MNLSQSAYNEIKSTHTDLSAQFVQLQIVFEQSSEESDSYYYVDHKENELVIDVLGRMIRFTSKTVVVEPGNIRGEVSVAAVERLGTWQESEDVFHRFWFDGQGNILAEPREMFSTANITGNFFIKDLVKGLVALMLNKGILKPTE